MTLTVSIDRQSKSWAVFNGFDIVRKFEPYHDEDAVNLLARTYVLNNYGADAQVEIVYPRIDSIRITRSKKARHRKGGGRRERTQHNSGAVPQGSAIMKTQTNDQVTPTAIGSEESGLTVEHILLSITIVSDKTSAGQFDDSCSFQLQRKMLEYNGVKNIEARVLYEHTKIEHHVNGCECHHCKPPQP